jgi:hypothetical protein
MGKIITQQIILDAGDVKNEHISESTEVDADKLQHLYKPGTNFDLAIGSTVATREEIVFVASGPGLIRAFSCLLNINGTTGDSDFDLKVNGSSVLTAVVNQDNADADKGVKDGVINSSALVAGDIVSIAVTRNSSHDGTGPYAWAEVEEGAN